MRVRLAKCLRDKIRVPFVRQLLTYTEVWRTFSSSKKEDVRDAVDLQSARWRLQTVPGRLAYSGSPLRMCVGCSGVELLHV